MSNLTLISSLYCTSIKLTSIYVQLDTCFGICNIYSRLLLLVYWITYAARLLYIYISLFFWIIIVWSVTDFCKRYEYMREAMSSSALCCVERFCSSVADDCVRGAVDV